MELHDANGYEWMTIGCLMSKKQMNIVIELIGRNAYSLVTIIASDGLWCECVSSTNSDDFPNQP